jgi:RsiW-degrading membrane proteinase PrsW (M82 family)
MLNLTEQIAQINPLLAEQMSKNAWLLPLFLLQIITKLVFYPIALYLSAKRKQKTWFVVLFVCLIFLNDFGLLAILYLIFNREKPHSKKKR